MSNITFLDGSIGQDLSGATDATFAMEWIGTGGQIDGGCCGVDPDHIAELVRRSRDADHSIA